MAEFSRTVYNYNDRIKINDTTTDTTKYLLAGSLSYSDTQVKNMEEERPTDMGIVDYGAKPGRGEIVLPVTLYATTMDNLKSLIQSLKQAFHPDLLEEDASYGSATDYNGFHPMKWTESVGGVSRDVQAYLKSMEIPQVQLDDMAGLIRKSRLRLRAEDPRKYKQTATTLSGAGTAANGGTVNTPVTITITATGTTSTSLTLTNSTTGESIYITTALTNGQVLVLNTRNHTARLNGTDKRSYIGNTSKWFMLKPGNNTIALSNNTNATISFSWADAWPL